MDCRHTGCLRYFIRSILFPITYVLAKQMLPLHQLETFVNTWCYLEFCISSTSPLLQYVDICDLRCFSLLLNLNFTLELTKMASITVFQDQENVIQDHGNVNIGVPSMCLQN